MLVTLTSGYGGTYELSPVSRRFGNRSILIQVDWDRPALARNLGWSGKLRRGDRCEHRGTDGTVTCPDCGATAADFINAATDWLDRNCGRTFRKHYAEDYFASDWD